MSKYRTSLEQATERMLDAKGPAVTWALFLSEPIYLSIQPSKKQQTMRIPMQSGSRATTFTAYSN